MTESEERTRYLIEPEYKKSAYDEQIWNNTLKNGKPVSVKVGNLYRWGSFYIELTDIQKEDLLKKESVLLNDYEEFELIEMWDGGCDFWVDIVDEDDFTEEELKEINALLYSSQENEGGLGACPQEDEGGLGACPQEDNGGLGACPQEDKGGPVESRSHHPGSSRDGAFSIEEQRTNLAFAEKARRNVLENWRPKQQPEGRPYMRRRCWRPKLRRRRRPKRIITKRGEQQQ